MAEPQPQRLTSWKEIAAYMGRDVRTVMRWEKERELPVRRGSGGRSGVVFANVEELDAWTRGGRETPEAAVPQEAPPVPVARAAPRRWSGAAAAVVVAGVALGIGGWRLGAFRANEPSGSVVLTDRAFIGRNAAGSETWRHAFPGETIAPPFARLANPIERLAGDGVLAGFSAALRDDKSAIRSGQVLWFGRAGEVKRSFSFEDRLSIGSRSYSPPWAVSDYQVYHGSRTATIAVTAHHFEWWPSIVTVLDDQWRRKGSFVHAGWVDHMRWLGDQRLAIAGFSNAEDGAMVALLDTRAMNGQGPTLPGGAFGCTACGPDRPVRYVVMPRSEVNRVAGSPFNRAGLSLRPGALLVWTVESPATATVPPADALYEFTPELTLVSASYTDRYWEAHQELERVGKITHTRQHCPERDGPPEIRVWEPGTGWTAVPTASRRARAASATEQ